MRPPNVILDPRDPDPNRRYKMTYVDMIGGRTAITKGYSADGIHWRLNGDEKPWFRRAHSSNLLGWDAVDRALRHLSPHIAATSGKRTPASGSRVSAIGRSTSRRLRHLVRARTRRWRPVPSDPGRDFKGLAAFFYEDLYLGWFWVFDRNQTAEAELVSSRDGKNWRRVAPGRIFFPRGGAGTWDSEMILVVAPVVRDDKIWIYYSGWNTPYTAEARREGRPGAGSRTAAACSGPSGSRRCGSTALSHSTRARQAARFLPGRSSSTGAPSRSTRGSRASCGSRRSPTAGRFRATAAAECLPLQGDGLRQPVRWKEHQTSTGCAAGHPAPLHAAQRQPLCVPMRSTRARLIGLGL